MSIQIKKGAQNAYAILVMKSIIHYVKKKINLMKQHWTQRMLCSINNNKKKSTKKRMALFEIKQIFDAFKSNKKNTR